LAQFSKNYRTFYQKNCQKALQNMVFGSGIRDPEKTHSGSRIRIRNTDKKPFLLLLLLDLDPKKIILDPDHNKVKTRIRIHINLMRIRNTAYRYEQKNNIISIQCCGSESGSGSTGTTCFWASRIRIH